jgi:hypothetical protein
MTELSVPTLIDWLGPEGAVAGLEQSNHTNADLMFLARKNGLTVEQKASRKQLAIELVMSAVKRIDKAPEYLLKMTDAELKRYFVDRMVSNTELTALLREFEIAPTGKLRGRLTDFAAREISELGVFQRVAKGSRDTNR